MRDAGAELKQDPGAGITDPQVTLLGGESVICCTKPKHFSDPMLCVLCGFFLNAQISIFIVTKDVGCMMLIYHVPIPISCFPPFLSAVCTRKVLFSSFWQSFALKSM